MNYKEQFYKYHGLDKCDVLPCIICKKIAVNLHHIEYGKGLKDDSPGNLCPLCMDCHDAHHRHNVPNTEQIKLAMLLTYLPF